jgi:hypothetical protein
LFFSKEFYYALKIISFWCACKKLVFYLNIPHKKIEGEKRDEKFECKKLEMLEII